MSGYCHTQSVHGMAGIQALGIEHVARRGHAGLSPPQSPLSKSASWRCIEDLNRSRVMDMDLIVSRRHLDSTHAQKNMVGAAGSLHSDRRRPDMPDVLRHECIEHTLRRCKSSPAVPRSVAQNDIVTHIRANHQAEIVGRTKLPSTRSKSPSAANVLNVSASRSPSFGMVREKSPRTFSRSPPPRTMGGTKSKSPRPGSRQLRAVSKQSRGGRTPRDEISITPPLLVTPPDVENNSSMSTEVFQQKFDLQSNMSTTASVQSIISPLHMGTAEQSISESCPGSARINDTASFCRLLDKKMAKLYEDQVHKIVLQQQKKAKKLAR